MSTLNEAIQAKIAGLEAQQASLKAACDEQVSAVQVQIDAAKAHLTGLGPWLEHELTAAKEAIAAVFADLGV